MGDKRKKHAPGFKAKVAIDALRERESIREISTRYQVHATQVSLWKGQLQAGRRASSSIPLTSADCGRITRWLSTSRSAD